MMQPQGFIDTKGANKVSKLQRSIYGLVQASQSWNIHFDSVIKAYGFIQTFGEACIYKKVSGRKVELDEVTVPAPLLESSPLIRPFCIMLLYRYLLHYGMLLHVMSQYLCIFSLILQGLHEEGECPQLEFWTGKRANLRDLFCTTPKVLTIYEELFWNI